MANAGPRDPPSDVPESKRLKGELIPLRPELWEPQEDMPPPMFGRFGADDVEPPSRRAATVLMTAAVITLALAFVWLAVPLRQAVRQHGLSPDSLGATWALAYLFGGLAGAGLAWSLWPRERVESRVRSAQWALVGLFGAGVALAVVLLIRWGIVG